MIRQLSINNHVINDDSDCYVIAEIGHNHQGDLEKAKQLFKAAKESGADAVKLQKRHNRTLYTKSLYDTPYNTEASFGATYGEHRDALEFGRDEYIELKRYADEIGITFYATAFDFASADFLANLNMPAYKIASGDIKSIPLLKHIAQIGRPIIMSTGGATMEDVRRAYDAIMPINTQLCILQCTAAYPAECKDLNLMVIDTFRASFPELVIGLSDHQNGIAMALVAYMLGARIVEKHFTINRSWKGTDHAFSLEPAGLQKMIRDLKRVREALGNGIKQPLPLETKPLFKMGKKLVAAKDIAAGHIITHDDIALKSPNDGLPPYELERVVGQVTIRALKEDENILFEDLQGR